MTNINPYFSATSFQFKTYSLNTNNAKPADFHFHESYEIYLCLTDDMTYIVNDHLYSLNTGDILIFNSSDIHKALPPNNRDYKRTLILFNPDFIRQMSTNKTNLLEFFESQPTNFNHRIHLKPSALLAFNEIVERSLSLSSDKDYAADIEKMVLLSQILVYINRYYRINNPRSNRSSSNPPTSIRLLLYLHTNYHDVLTLDDLAHRFGINQNLLNHEFKKMTGYTITQYLINYRIFIAKCLLKQGESVSRAAEKSGFGNLSHFIRTFHDRVGVSPKQFKLHG